MTRLIEQTTPVPDPVQGDPPRNMIERRVEDADRHVQQLYRDAVAAHMALDHIGVPRGARGHAEAMLTQRIAWLLLEMQHSMQVKADALRSEIGGLERQLTYAKRQLARFETEEGAAQ